MQDLRDLFHKAFGARNKGHIRCPTEGGDAAHVGGPKRWVSSVGIVKLGSLGVVCPLFAFPFPPSYFSPSTDGWLNISIPGGSDLRRVTGINDEVSLFRRISSFRGSSWVEAGYIEQLFYKNRRKVHTLPLRIALDTRSHDGLPGGATFKRLSSNTRYALGRWRVSNAAASPDVALNLKCIPFELGAKVEEQEKYPGYSSTSFSSRSSLSFSRSALIGSPLASPSEAYRYGSLKKRSLCRIMPRDHISAFESICCSSPVRGDGSDSGEVYSRLDISCPQLTENDSHQR
jgi:hypothetical protein